MHKVGTGLLQQFREVSGLLQVPAAFNPIAGRQTHAQHAMERFANRAEHLQRETRPVGEIAAVVVVALVGDG